LHLDAPLFAGPNDPPTFTVKDKYSPTGSITSLKWTSDAAPKKVEIK